LPTFGAGAHAETPSSAGSRRSKTPEKSRKAGKKSKKRVAPEPSAVSEEPSSATDDELARGLGELKLDAPSVLTLLPQASAVLPSPTWSAPASPVAGGARAGLLALEDSDPPQFNASTATFDQLMDISSRESSRPPSPDKVSKSSKSKKASKKHHKEKSHKHSKDAHDSDKEGIPEEAVAPTHSTVEPVSPVAAIQCRMPL
jgi:hypothetical protein